MSAGVGRFLARPVNETSSVRPREARITGIVLLYLFFLAVACALPLLHARLVDPALEATRDPMLLPAPFLLLKWLSGIGELLAFIVVACGVWLCFAPKRVIGVSVALAVLLLAFTTLYGCYAAVLLSSELSHSPFTARLFTPSK